MATSEPTLYEILGVDVRAPPGEITRAFRARSVETHPDKNPGDQAAARRFIEVVQAYQTLSDMHARAAYDARVLAGRSVTAAYGITLEDALDAPLHSVMDTPADDVLEEYVVGNSLPRDATMLTFFRDLERTERFILLREGRSAYHEGDHARAVEILTTLARINPDNILVRFFFGLALHASGRTRRAFAELRHCLVLGEARVPVRTCPGIRRKLHELYRRHWRFGAAWLLARRSTALMGPDALVPVDRDKRRLDRLALAESIRLDREDAARTRRLGGPRG